MTKTKYIIGSVSSDTIREEDLIPAFMDALEALNPDKAKAIRENPENEPIWDWLTVSDEARSNGPDEMPELATWLLDELFGDLDECAPPYFYFGASEGDGADYGFWLSESALEDFDGLRVNDTSEVPEDYCGEVLHVNDHGNATLYAKDEGSSELREIWAIV